MIGGAVTATGLVKDRPPTGGGGVAPLGAGTATGSSSFYGSESLDGPTFSLGGGDYAVSWWAQDQGDTGTAGCNYYLKLQSGSDLIPLGNGDVAAHTKQTGSNLVYGVPGGQYHSTSCPVAPGTSRSPRSRARGYWPSRLTSSVALLHRIPRQDPPQLLLRRRSAVRPLPLLGGPFEERASPVLVDRGEVGGLPPLVELQGEIH